jgi:hypothetical protein
MRTELSQFRQDVLINKIKDMTNTGNKENWRRLLAYEFITGPLKDMFKDIIKHSPDNNNPFVEIYYGSGLFRRNKLYCSYGTANIISDVVIGEEIIIKKELLKYTQDIVVIEMAATFAKDYQIKAYINDTETYSEPGCLILRFECNLEYSNPSTQ